LPGAPPAGKLAPINGEAPMRALWLGLAVGLFAGPLAASARAPAPVVFFDIAGPDLKSQAEFYRTVFGWEVRPDGGFSVPVASPLPGNLRVEPSSQGPVIERVVYVGVPDVTAALAKVVAHGGKVVFGRTVVPGAVVVGLFTDPAGNRMGLVEMEGDRVKVPPAGK
jgi:predicted enzyme related to lactoylglutathione lyase